MGITKRIVCLANSRKHSGRCVAGRELIRGRPGAWVRPVSSRQKEEVSMSECHYEDESNPCVLDIIDVPLLNPRSNGHQKENWLLDSDYYWAKAGKYPWSSMDRLTDKDGTLWRNGYKTYNGLNDRIPLDMVANETSSLKLIFMENLQIKVFQYYNRPKVQAWFWFAGANYALQITDPVIEREYETREDGEYRLRNCYLTISLGEPFNGYCYKLVAAVIRESDANND